MPWIIVALAYIVGSIPTAYVAGRLLKGVDIRQMGDGNVGAQNAFRQLGSGIGLGVFFIDAGKGVLAVIIAQATSITQFWVLLTGVAAVVGHNWPLFLGFRGGRGEATTIGVLLAVITQPIIILAGPALVTLLIKRNVVIASCVLFVPLSLVCWWSGVPGSLVAYSIVLPCLVGFTDVVRRRQVAHTSSAGST